jgi:regulator of protease activity HflC (stomatin/prohibitin superfamily)
MSDYISPGAIVGLVVAAVLIIGGGLYGCPLYGVYQQRLVGEAELARAEYQRRTAVVEAEAKLAAAGKLAEAEVARAKGLAQANQILGQSLTGEEGAAYLRYLWIQRMEEGGGRTVVYVPTETNLPMFLESGRGTSK